MDLKFLDIAWGVVDGSILGHELPQRDRVAAMAAFEAIRVENHIYISDYSFESHLALADVACYRGSVSTIGAHGQPVDYSVRRFYDMG